MSARPANYTCLGQLPKGTVELTGRQWDFVLDVLVQAEGRDDLPEWNDHRASDLPGINDLIAIQLEAQMGGAA